MFHRLMGRPILTQPYGIVGEHVGDGNLHEGGHTHGRAHVVREHQEGAGERAEAAMKGHAIQEGGHGVLPDPEVDDSSSRALGQKVTPALDVGLVRAGQVG